MRMRIISLLGLLAMIIAVVGLFRLGVLFTANLFAVALQVAAVALLIWARITFGRRSFHAAANPTAGGLVTTGPYRYIRHPIYTAACLFCWASILVHPSWTGVAFGTLLFLGVLARMLSEEQLVTQRYPGYVEYSKSTRRMIPYVF